MFRKMLLCFDGSHEGREALRQGAELAAACHGEVHLLAVIKTGAMSLVGETLSTEAPLLEYQERVNAVLQQGVDELRNLGVTAHGHVAMGDPVTEISEMARSLHADLVVLGHHTQSSFARWWHGSPDASLLDAVDCSILICIEPAAEPES